MCFIILNRYYFKIWIYCDSLSVNLSTNLSLSIRILMQFCFITPAQASPRCPRVDKRHGLVSAWGDEQTIFPSFITPTLPEQSGQSEASVESSWPIRGQYYDGGDEGVLFPAGHVWHPEHASCGHETLTRHMDCLWSGYLTRYGLCVLIAMIHWVSGLI